MTGISSRNELITQAQGLIYSHQLEKIEQLEIKQIQADFEISEEKIDNLIQQHLNNSQKPENSELFKLQERTKKHLNSLLGFSRKKEVDTVFRCYSQVQNMNKNKLLQAGISFSKKRKLDQDDQSENTPNKIPKTGENETPTTLVTPTLEKQLAVPVIPLKQSSEPEQTVITGRHRNNYEKNKATVINFPCFEPSGHYTPGVVTLFTNSYYKIEVSPDGILSSKLRGRQWMELSSNPGLPLDKALLEIMITLAILDEKINTSYNEACKICQIKGHPYSGPTTENLNKLKELFSEKVKLVSGLMNIKEHYNAYYTNDKNHEGLPLLNLEFCRREDDLKQQRDIFISQFPSIDWQECPKSATPPVDKVSAAKNLKDYLKAYNQDLFFDDVKRLIEEGHSLITSIFSNEHCRPSQDPKTSERNLACIVWYLMWYAIEKKQQGFEEGAFVIESGQHSEKLITYMKSLFDCYPRPSSHFKNRLVQGENQPIWAADVFNGLMPANKRTVLLQLVQPFQGSEPLLFLKPENYSARPAGSNLYDLTMHGLDFIFTRTIDNDSIGKQKEHVPYKVRNAFEALINSMIEDEKCAEIADLSQAVAKAEILGIAYMTDFINRTKKITSSQNVEVKTNELEEIISQLLPTDEKTIKTQHKRMGREVYITEDDIQLILKKRPSLTTE